MPRQVSVSSKEKQEFIFASGYLVGLSNLKETCGPDKATLLARKEAQGAYHSSRSSSANPPLSQRETVEPLQQKKSPLPIPESLHLLPVVVFIVATFFAAICASLARFSRRQISRKSNPFHRMRIQRERESDGNCVQVLYNPFHLVHFHVVHYVSEE